MTDHEVRGVWFVSAREEVLDLFGEGAFEVLVASLPARHQHTLIDADPSKWYPEDALQACLQGLRLRAAGEPTIGFGALLERCTERGIGRFFSAVIRLTSPRFVLDRVPMMWNRIRRGSGSVSVEHEDATTTMLSYRDFPYFADPIYEELTVCSLRALVRTCTGRDPDVTVVRSTDDALDVRVVHSG